MGTEPICPKCACVHTYQDGNLWVCPECAHEWTLGAAPIMEEETVDGDDGHDISCKIDGIGAMFLKSEFVKKI